MVLNALRLYRRLNEELEAKTAALVKEAENILVNFFSY
jgi:hypothetical protein